MLSGIGDHLVKSIWQGRRPKEMHPRVLFSVRKHLAVLHAALCIDDVQQACRDNLERVEDESVPFPDSASVQMPGESKLWRIRLGYGWWLYFEFVDSKAMNLSLDCEDAVKVRRIKGQSGFRMSYGPPPEPISPQSWH